MKKIYKNAITIAMIMVLCLIWGGHSYAREMDDGYRMPEWELKGNTVIISGTGAFEQQLGGIFGNAKNVKVVVEEGITSLPHGFLSGDNSVTSVEISESVKEIGSYAFDECSNLKSVIIKANIEEIKEETFRRCRKLEKVELPDSVKSIGEYAFDECDKLDSIKIPENVMHMGNGVFERCFNLKNVVIPKKMTVIPDYTFTQCESLKNIVIPDNVETIGEGAFDCCKSLKKIMIPSGTRRIKDCAFGECSNLEKIDIPDAVESVGIQAFVDCRKLKEINLSKKLSVIEIGTFMGCDSLKSIDIPAGVKTIKWYAFSECFTLEQVNIPNTVTYIGKCAFEDSHKLKNVSIPSSVTEIGDYAFGYCTSLAYVQSVSDYKMRTMASDKYKVRGFTIIGKKNSAAYRYAKKHKFEFYTSLKYIKVHTVKSCRYRIKNNSEVTFLGIANKKIKNATIPSTVKIDKKTYKVTSISPNALRNKGITKLTIGKNVVTIGIGAFNNCRKLKKIIIKSLKLKTIGKDAFKKLPKNLVVKVPSKKIKLYKKLLKKQKIKFNITK